MLLEVLFKNTNSSLVIDVENHSNCIKSYIPFKSEATTWKQEICFPSPIKIDFSEKDFVYRVKRGGVYYWPPQKAICMFHGFSQPYTPVIHIGAVVDALHTIAGWSGPVEVFEHVIDERFKDVVKKLQDLGYRVATPLRNGEKIVSAYKYSGRNRISFNVYVEEYGMHLEGEGIAKYANDITNVQNLLFIKRTVELFKPRYARPDISENNDIVITAGINNIDELEVAVKELEKIYKQFEVTQV
ncbi:MAG: cyclophilin-like family protein [Ignisphaera sp.]